MLRCKCTDERRRCREIFLRHRIRCRSIHTGRVSRPHRERPNFGDIAAHSRGLHLIEQVACRRRTQAARPRAHRVKHDSPRKRMRMTSRRHHRGNRPRVQRPDVETQPRAEFRDLLDLFRVVRHNRTRPRREQNIRHIVHRHIVRDAVDEGRSGAYGGEYMIEIHCVILSWRDV